VRVWPMEQGMITGFAEVYLDQGGSPAVPAPLNGLGTSAIGLSAALRNPV